jgi:hypothetical protein
MASAATEESTEEVKVIYTRGGYDAKDLIQSFHQCLSEQGHVSHGKLMHYTADIICSGGLRLWQKQCMDYAFEHIGLSNPRIFLYLKKRFEELNEYFVKVTPEQFARHVDIQKKITEVVLVIQQSPKRPKPKYPKVHPNTHINDTWLENNCVSPEKAVVRKVWENGYDMVTLYNAGNELIHACTMGATERALFWAKWILEEDALLRKEYKSGLTTKERGPFHQTPKMRQSAGHFITAILAESYKEYAAKGLLRMHEEFQSFIDLFRSNETYITPTKKFDSIMNMIYVISDVPKWKTPSARNVVSDKIALTRAVNECDSFFREILAKPALLEPLPNRIAVKQQTTKNKNKKEKVMDQIDMMDSLFNDFYNF